MQKEESQIPTWMKTKGYLHISQSLQISNKWKIYKSKIENPDFISKYAFYPLIHSIIRERKYKKVDKTKHSNQTDRCHNFKNQDGTYEKTAKNRPLHYASHFDALIYAYYASILNDLYDKELKKDYNLDLSINAYRKIIDDKTGQGKSTIHFAKEVFDEIKERSISNSEVGVLTFDIKSFFSSLDHNLLEKKWANLIGEENLPKHHKNVFKSCTDFRYILKDDLRVIKRKSGKRSGFDEKKLAKIRREKGFKCFFASNEEFRKNIKSGKLRVYKNPFFQPRGNSKVQVGIPQGLPISAVLANLYLLDFDKKIVDCIVKKHNGFYRRYSDDIIVVCGAVNIEEIKKYVENLILDSNLEISKSKTEKFIFRQNAFNKNGDQRLTSIKIIGSEEKIDSPLIYLGFEFRGYNVCIKSTNLAKFYRRLISIVKRRARRAKQNRNPNIPKAIFKNQVKKLYKKPLRDLDGENNDIPQSFRKKIYLVENNKKEFSTIIKPIKNKNKSNYFSYLGRCKKIFGDDIFFKQLRKKEHILNSAIKKHLNN